MQHMCMYVHLCIIYCLMTVTVTKYAHTKTICLGSQCVSVWVRLKLCHVTYSLLSSLPQGGLVQDKRWIWLGPCFLVHHNVSSLLNSGFRLKQKKVLSLYFNAQANDRGVYTSLKPVAKMKVLQQQNNPTKSGFEVQLSVLMWCSSNRKYSNKL